MRPPFRQTQTGNAPLGYSRCAHSVTEPSRKGELQ